MALLKSWKPKGFQSKDTVFDFFTNLSRNIQNQIVGFLSKLLPPRETSVDQMKKEVWVELSSIYYKYDDPTQKKAFREVVSDLSESINEGEWQVIYRRLYRARDII